MRVFVLRRCNVPLLKSASMAALAIAVTGCSSGFERFDSAYNSVRPNTVNSQVSTPAGVDNMTTASTSRRLVPVADVAPKIDPQAAYHHRAEPTYVAPQPAGAPYASAPTYQQPQPVATAPYATAPVRQSYQPAQQPVYQTPQPTYRAPQQLTYTPPQPDPAPTGGANEVYIPDTTTTASVVRKAPLVPATSAAAASAKVGTKGWTVNGGTRIVARPGETLYNLSKRYGVPVDSIRKANAMSADDQLKAGQSIMIPSYRYSPTTATSAPDADKSTRAAKASIGFVGEADPKKVPVPLTAPRRYAAQTYAQAGSSTRTVNIPEYRMPRTAPNVDTMTTGAINPKVNTLPQAPARTGITDFRWPVKGRVIAEFGSKTTGGPNEGVDISVPEGTAVRSAENGVVIYAGSGISEYGKLILVQHADNWVSAYAHNSDFEVKKGDRVARGDIIARSGKSGDADRPKLHFELRKNSVPVNPSKYLASS